MLEGKRRLFQLPMTKPEIAQERIRRLAYLLWEARGRPLGSPEVDWFLAERLVADYRPPTPFDEFIRKAIAALNTPTVDRRTRNVPEYARVIEERRYAIDIVDRAEMLGFAYARLQRLSALHRDAEALIEATKRVSRQEPLTWEVPDEVGWQLEFRASEARVLIAFTYYELTSLAHMLEALGIQIPPGELQYLVKARDKFLAHPQWRGRVRNAHASLNIPFDGLLHPAAVNVAETDPVLLEFYRSSFGSLTDADEARLRRENEELISSPKKNSKFSPQEVLRLKAFGIREPDPQTGLEEMAGLLLYSVLPEIERISTQTIPALR